LSENADDGGFFIAFPHSIKVWRVRNARHKSHPRVTVASESTFSANFHTPGAGHDKEQAVKSLCGALI
jgi:hypothetical protein